MKVDFDYDAFVICNPEGKDLEFANKLVDTMQASPYNLKLCAPWRNAGACSPNTRECTRDRCRKFLVVLSNNFYKSEEAVSHLHFAFSMSPGYKERRILPICLERCEIPTYLQLVTKLDVSNSRTRKWMWEQLYLSLKPRETGTHSEVCEQQHWLCPVHPKVDAVHVFYTELNVILWCTINNNVMVVIMCTYRLLTSYMYIVIRPVTLF